MADDEGQRLLPPGGGEMGARIRAFDWSGHALGDPARWPPALRVALGICLNSSFPTAIYWGPELRLLYNDAWSHIPAERHPWALGRAGAEVWSDIWDVVGPQLDQVMASGEGFSTFDQMLPMRRGGQPRETYWNYSFTPILDEDGRVAGVFNQGHETTDIVMAARAREAETERLRETFAQAPGGIAVLRGPDHVFEIANRAYVELVGERPDIIGKTVAEALPEVAEQGFVDLLNRVYRTGEAYVGAAEPVELDRGEGRETRIVDFIYQPTRDPGGAVDGIFVQVTDVTERARLFKELEDLNATLEQRVSEEVAERSRAEEQLRQAQKMEAIGQLTGGVAHDFNNMLAVVIGALNLMQRRLERGETDVGRYVDSAMDGAQRASALTQRLLAFSRQQPLQPRGVDAGALIASMADLMGRTLGETVRLDMALAPELWPCLADPPQLESAILNLAVNARDAMADGGVLTIATRNARVGGDAGEGEGPAAGEYVVIAVTDTGEGMTPDVAARAFDPFFTTKAVGKGSGLGLSQVFGFLRQSGGHVELASEPGAGTMVELYLPRCQGVAEARTESAPARAQRADGEETVLVVEDDERVRNFSVEALKELGYRVRSASGGAEAMRLLEGSDRLDLMFTDIVMPDANGRNLATAARALRPGLKVLLTTGYASNAGEDEADAGGADLLQKPFTLDQLAARVRGVLDA